MSMMGCRYYHREQTDELRAIPAVMPETDAQCCWRGSEEYSHPPVSCLEIEYR